MNQQIAILLLGTLPALFVLLAPFWIMVYFDQRALQQRNSVHARAPRPLQALSGGLYQKVESA
jgi:hypothetical protein